MTQAQEDREEFETREAAALNAADADITGADEAQGFCRFCGQSYWINPQDDTDEAIEEAATLACSCADAQRHRMYKKAEARIDEYIASVDDGTLGKALHLLARSVWTMTIDKLALKVNESTKLEIYIKDDKLVVKRTTVDVDEDAIGI